MEHIHSREYLSAGDVVVIDCDTQCNCTIMDDNNYHTYNYGGQYAYHGGHYKFFPAHISVPRAGYWNIAIDLGGGSANIRYSINVIRRGGVRA